MYIYFHFTYPFSSPMNQNFVATFLLFIIITKLALLPPGRCVGAGIELFLQTPSHFGVSLPATTPSTTAIGDKKVFVKLSDKQFRPIFVAHATLEAPFLYVDQNQKIRAIEPTAIRIFLAKKLLSLNKYKKGDNNDNNVFMRLLNIAIGDAFFAISVPDTEASRRFDPNADIYEICNDNLKNGDGTSRCLYFFLSEGDDLQFSQECLRLQRILFGKTIPSSMSMIQWVINQLNWPESVRWMKERGKCITVEQDIPEKSKKAVAENAKIITLEAMLSDKADE